MITNNMITISCKKCNTDCEVLNRRYKICNNCKINGIKRICKTSISPISVTPISMVRSSIKFDMFKDIYFLVPEICSYLTISEVNNFSMTSKENRYIINVSEKNWMYFIQRDYGTNGLVSNVDIESVDLLKFGLALDSYIICHECKKSKCVSECPYKRCAKVSKTHCLKYYRLTEDELRIIPNEVKYNNFYKKNITMFKHYHIKRFVCNKYTGFTNFKIETKKIEEENRLRIERRNNKIEEEKRQFNKWLGEYRTSVSFKYDNLTQSERQKLLFDELNRIEKIHGITFLHENYEHSYHIFYNSKVILSFINGTVTDKSLDEVASMIHMSSILLRYREFIHEDFINLCRKSMEKLMFKNRHRKNYKWTFTVIPTFKKYNNQIQRYLSYENFYYN